MGKIFIHQYTNGHNRQFCWWLCPFAAVHRSSVLPPTKMTTTLNEISFSPARKAHLGKYQLTISLAYGTLVLLFRIVSHQFNFNANTAARKPFRAPNRGVFS